MVGTGAKWSVTALFTGLAAMQSQLIVTLEEGKTSVSRSLVCFFESQTYRGICSKFTNFKCIVQ